MSAQSNYQVFVRSLRGNTLAVDVSADATVCSLKNLLEAREGLPADQQLLTHGGRCLEDNTTLSGAGLTCNTTIDLSLRLLGGKGGFGSNLRAAGKRQLTDNFDACRDLQGRRIRQKTAETKLAEWKAEAPERELEKIALQHMKEKTRAEQRVQEIEVDVKTVRKETKDTLKGVQSAVAFALKKQDGAAIGSGNASGSRSGEEGNNKKGAFGRSKAASMDPLLMGLSDDDSDESDSEEEEEEEEA